MFNVHVVKRMKQKDFVEVAVEHIVTGFFSSFKDLKDKTMEKRSSFSFFFSLFLWAVSTLPSTGAGRSGWSCGWQFLLEIN